jgi:hypothetical protein
MARRKASKAKGAAPKPEAPTCTCFTATGKLHHDVFTVDLPEEASALALLGAACCPWESAQHIVGGTLQQIHHELEVLAQLDFGSEEFDIKDVKWLLAGMASRCRVALEVDLRIKRLPEPEQIANAAGPVP